MKYKKLRGHIQHQTNPFLEDGLLKITTHKRQVIAGSTDQVLVDVKTGQVNGHSALLRWREVDDEQFVKLYVANATLWLELTKTGQKVFTYLCGNLQKNNDMVLLDPAIIAKEVGYKNENSIFSGLGELVDKQVIARTKYAHFYYVNPHFIFNGDRVVFAEMLVRKRKTGGKEDPKQLPLFDRK